MFPSSPSALRRQRVQVTIVTLAGLVVIVGLGTRIAPADHPTDGSWAASQSSGPIFSVGSGFYDQPFSVEITAPATDLPILYTLDGSYPDPVENAARTHLYHGPLTVDETTGADRDDPALSSIDPTIPGLFEDWSPPAGPVQTATVLRARPVDGAETVATYLVGPQLRRATLAVVSLVADPAYLFDHETGIYVPGRLAEEHLADPSADHDLGWRTPANYAQRGREWERPSTEDHRGEVWLEHCPPSGPCRQQPIGVRIHGTSSRAQPHKSLRLYARGDDGAATFSAPLLGPDGVTDHQRLLLRASGNDWDGLLLADAFLQGLMGTLAVDTQASEPVVVFLNGEYWGVHNVRERYDAAYLQRVHGVDGSAVVLLDQWLEVTAGPPDADRPFRALLSAAADAVPGDPVLRARIEREVDVDSFLDHVIAHVFVANEDWPNNNVRLWRDPTGSGDPGEGVRDGRWRWMIMDLDQMGGTRGRYDPSHDPFTRRLRPSDDPDFERGYPLLFHRLLAYDDLRERFANRFADLLNTSFAPEHTLPELARAAARLRPELPLHRARWWPDEDEGRWETELAQFEAFLGERPARQREQLAALLGVDGTATLTVTTDAAAGRLRVNSIEVAPETPGLTRADRFEGVYLTDVAITITATSQPGARFLGWEGLPDGAVIVSQGSSGGVVRVRLQEDTEVTAVFARR